MHSTKKTLSEQAADYMKGLIRSGRLKPGEVINENRVAEALKISRAPIREAMLVLGHQGIITMVAQKAKRVRSLTPAEIRDSYVVAGILEGAASAFSVTQWHKEEFEAFCDVVEVMDERLSRLESSDQLSEIDDMFHRGIYYRCQNSIILDLSTNSSTSIAKFLYFDIWKNMFTKSMFQERHHKVAEAVMTGKADVIEKTVRAHYAEIGEELAKAVLEHSEG